MKLLISTLIFLLMIGTPLTAKGQEKKGRPNIILILADDMGFSDIGCYGSEIDTPNLDRLGAEGIRFSAMRNNARCCPSRAALLSGLYPHQAGVGEMTDTDLPIPEYQGFLNEQTVTIADVLRESGYATYLSGKWHLGEEPENWPLKHGFDDCFALINGASSYFDFKPYRNTLWPPGNELTVVRGDRPISMDHQAFYATDLYTDEAIRFIKKNPEGTPFFLYLSYTAPHWPLHALPEDIKKYDGKYDEGWDVIRGRRFERLQQSGLINARTKLSEKNRPDRDWQKLTPEEKAKESRLMEVYAAMIDRMDQNIGRLLGELKKTGQLDNTLILFLSDNGGSKAGSMAMNKYTDPRFDAEALPGTAKSFTGYGPNWANVSNTPFREFKSDIYEGGIASPFIVWYPKKVPAGKIDHSAVHIIDLMPTLCEIAKTAYPIEFRGNKVKPKQGMSLVRHMVEEEIVMERPLFFEHLGNCGVIEGNWKIVRKRNDPWELYNLKTDRSELDNKSEQYPQKLNDLKEKYKAWAVKNKVLPRKEVEKAMIYQFD